MDARLSDADPRMSTGKPRCVRNRPSGINKLPLHTSDNRQLSEVIKLRTQSAIRADKFAPLDPGVRVNLCTNYSEKY